MIVVYIWKYTYLVNRPEQVGWPKARGPAQGRKGGRKSPDCNCSRAFARIGSCGGDVSVTIQPQSHVTEYKVKLTRGNVQGGVRFGIVGDTKELLFQKSIPDCVTLGRGRIRPEGQVIMIIKEVIIDGCGS
jgi:hypothetical protein